MVEQEGNQMECSRVRLKEGNQEKRTTVKNTCKNSVLCFDDLLSLLKGNSRAEKGFHKLLQFFQSREAHVANMFDKSLPEA